MLDPAAAYALWAESYPPYAHNALMRAEERALLALIPERLDGLCILDAGCGSGRYVLLARSRGACHVVGFDLSREMLQRGRREDIRTPLVQADLRRIPIRNGWADLVLCSLAVGHLDDLYEVLGEFRRVTHRGGLICCSDFHPEAHRLGWRREFAYGGRQYAVHHIVHPLDRWREVCVELELTIEEMKDVFVQPPDLMSSAVPDPRIKTTPIVLAVRIRS